MPDSAEPAVGGSPLLATKFFVPGWRTGMVSRPRLVTRLANHDTHSVTIVSAPPGFGKSTLLAEWLTTGPGVKPLVAWLSLEQADNDPVRFWTYVVAALERAHPGPATTARTLLTAPQPPPIETVLTVLINDLAAFDGTFVLVLDDYHLIETVPIHDAVRFLIDHLPPQLHLVISGRADPSIPMNRLRAGGKLLELRAADLRFTPAEATAFLNDSMGLQLAPEVIAALDARTEGWIAGLQLAALSLQHRGDARAFVSDFSGDDRHILDYLVDEVLARQPAALREFLLETAILARLSGPLCDAVTGRSDSGELLASLEHRNVFVVPLDDKRRWYRYHHLFADVLAAHLRSERPERVSTLHLRASEWFERDGALADAIRHALNGGDAERAASLLERLAPELRRTRQEIALRRWVEALPDELIRRRPVLGVLYAGALAAAGEFDGIEERLRDAERWLPPGVTPGTVTPPQPNGVIVVDAEAFRRLPASIAMYRSAHALVSGDLTATIDHARITRERAEPGDHLASAAGAGLVGLALWTQGNLDDGHSAYMEAVAGLKRAGHVSDVLGCTIALADIRIAQGRLHDATRTYTSALQYASAQNLPFVRGLADMYAGLADIHHEQGDLTAAAQAIETAQGLGEHWGLPQYPYRSRVAQARGCEAHGDVAGAIALIDEAEHRYVSDFFPNVRPLAARRARLWLAQGRLGEALDWARAQGLAAGDELSYMREFEHITFARLLLAQESPSQRSIAFLNRLLAAAEAGGRIGSAIEILMLLSCAFQARDETSRALASLERAVSLAEPEGFVRLFTDGGEPMRALLERLPAETAFVRQLRRSFGSAAGNSPAVGTASGLAEPLTPREIEILRLIATGLRNQEIADCLFLSVATVKRHIANAYGKLGAGHRTEALARANELKLL